MTATLGLKARTKLLKWWHQFSSADSTATLTMGDMVSFFGLAVWGSSVFIRSTAEFYFVYKYFRRRAAQTLTSPAAVWPSIIHTLRRWILRLLQSSRPLKNSAASSPDVVVFSDACPEGYGVIAHIGAAVYISAGPFLLNEDIAVLESRAFLHAVLFTRRVCQDRLGAIRPTIHFYVDNTSVIGAFERGRSPVWLLNVLVARLHHNLHQFCDFSVSYVRSASNLADYWSRLGYRVVTSYNETPLQQANFATLLQLLDTPFDR